MRASARSRICIDLIGKFAQGRSDFERERISVFEHTQRIRQPGQFGPRVMVTSSAAPGSISDASVTTSPACLPRGAATHRRERDHATKALPILRYIKSGQPSDDSLKIESRGFRMARMVVFSSTGEST